MNLFTFAHVGEEVIDGRPTHKILMRSPYLPGQDAYTYFWIGADDGHYLVRSKTLIENDPARKIQEKRYIYADASPPRFPTRVEEEYNEIVDDQTHLKYRASYSFHSVVLNEVIDDERFSFQFPDGTLVTDKINQTTFVVREEAPLIAAAITDQESWHTNIHWWAVGTGVLALAAGTLAILRRKPAE